eukprot:GFYU01000322.1.p1 GENE.GFYU01000322.1~~GFYU01000322.1.p1  ORF type:complete len:496 (-),score=109.55 GFYU01000322.1:54-1487(-)
MSLLEHEILRHCLFAVEFLQIISLLFVNRALDWISINADWSGVIDFFSLPSLAFSVEFEVDKQALFWVVSGIMIFTYGLAILSQTCCELEAIEYFVAFSGDLILGPGFIPSMRVLFGAFACTEEGDRWYPDPELTCWEGAHIGVAVFAILAIIGSVPGIVLKSIRDDTESHNASKLLGIRRSVSYWQSKYNLYRFIGVLLALFVVDDVTYGVLMFVFTLGMCVYLLITMPFIKAKVNIAQAAYLTGAMWMSFSAMIFSFSSDVDFELMILTPLIMAAAVYFAIKKVKTLPLEDQRWDDVEEGVAKQCIELEKSADDGEIEAQMDDAGKLKLTIAKAELIPQSLARTPAEATDITISARQASTEMPQTVANDIADWLSRATTVTSVTLTKFSFAADHEGSALLSLTEAAAQNQRIQSFGITFAKLTGKQALAVVNAVLQKNRESFTINVSNNDNVDVESKKELVALKEGSTSVNVVVY